MAGEPLAAVKLGANQFIDIIQQSTGGAPGEIGSGSRIGVVTFAATAIPVSPLTTSVQQLKAAVNGMQAAGSTNHADAFLKAMELFDPASSNAKVIVLFTDGKTTTGFPPAPVAAEARSRGIIIYCIGLIGSDGLDVQALNDWATDPDISHVAVTPDISDLEKLFAELAANISKPGATGIVIEEEVEPDFEIVEIWQYSKGAAEITGPTTLRWQMDALGTSGNEGVFLEFYIRHVGQTDGKKKVNRSISYHDAENNVVLFPNPEVTVECSVPFRPESCPVPIPVELGGCADLLRYDLGRFPLCSGGWLLQFDLTLCSVCPGKRTALGLYLSEKGKPRGFKAFTIPAHHAPGCRDVEIRGISFVLPEDLNPCDKMGCFCEPRYVDVRVYANYLDYCEPCSKA